jgi:hypothetical protein
MRRVVRCETVSYREWSPQELLELSLAADEPEAITRVWPGYRHVRHDDPLPGGARNGSPLPDREWLGQALTISDFISDREFRRGGLYAEMCKPFGVRAVMKVYLPTSGATASQFVFDTTRNRFTDTDRLALQRLIPYLGATAGVLRGRDQGRRVINQDTPPTTLDHFSQVRAMPLYDGRGQLCAAIRRFPERNEDDQYGGGC